jgi:hypothetical protein
LTETAVQKRVQFSEIVAINSASLAENDRLADLEQVLQQLLARNEELVSLGIRKRDGSYRMLFGEHAKNWKPEEKRVSRSRLKLNRRGEFGERLSFASNRSLPAVHPACGAIPSNLILYVSAASCLLSWFTLSRTFRYLDRSKVVPNRVRSALDSLAEGLVLIDQTHESCMLIKPSERWSFAIAMSSLVPRWLIFPGTSKSKVKTRPLPGFGALKLTSRSSAA